MSTVAVLAWPDGRWTTLRFDDQQALPSAVHTDPDGRTVTGHQAWQRADDTSGTFTESPLRTGTTAELAARESAQALTAATLRRVTDEAARIAGEPVHEVRLVVPARWGPRRRTWLRGAATQAGIPQPILIPAPTAVAGLLPTLGVPVPDNAALLIMDLGSGCEATVLRRTSNGYDVSSAVHEPAAGGDAIDELLVTHINQLTAPPPAAAVHGSALSPDTTVPAAVHDERPWALLAGVRAGKEALTYRATASVGRPPPAPAAIITTDTVRHAARPVLHRAVTLAQQAIAAADIEADDLYGVYCIGAAAATPGLADAVTERLGIIPAVMPDPETIAALGAAGATPDGEPPATPPTGAAGALAAIATVILLAAASLTLLAQFLLTTTSAGRNPTADPVNWGELALATMFAVLACLAASPKLGTLLQHIVIAQTHAPPPQPTQDSQLRYGTVLGATIGLALTGVYAVFAALYASLPLGSALRWAVLPAACIAAVSVTAVLATTHPRPDQHRVGVRTANLKFPPGAIALTTAGMLLVQYTLTVPRPPDLATYLDLGTRIGGLLIGIGIAFTLVKALLLRLVLALPWGLLTAVIASSTTTGILATVFALAVLCWCGYPFLNLLTVTSAPRTPQHDLT